MFFIIIFVIPTAYSLVPNIRHLHVGEMELVLCAAPECTECTTDLVAIDDRMHMEMFISVLFLNDWKNQE